MEREVCHLKKQVHFSKTQTFNHTNTLVRIYRDYTGIFCGSHTGRIFFSFKLRSHFFLVIPKEKVKMLVTGKCWWGNKSVK